MVKIIIDKLKEASELIGPEIQSASRGIRNADVSRFQYAREMVQSAITKLLEVYQY